MFNLFVPPPEFQIAAGMSPEPQFNGGFGGAPGPLIAPPPAALPGAPPAAAPPAAATAPPAAFQPIPTPPAVAPPLAGPPGGGLGIGGFQAQPTLPLQVSVDGSPPMSTAQMLAPFSAPAQTQPDSALQRILALLQAQRVPVTNLNALLGISR